MPSDFNANEFRRSRKGSGDSKAIPAPSVATVAPVDLPTFQGLEPYVPVHAQQPVQAQPSPAPSAPVFDSSVNPYAAALETAPASVVIPDAVPNPYAAVPVAAPSMAPLSVPAPLQGPGQASAVQGFRAHLLKTQAPADEPEIAITPEREKTSLFAGLFSKIKSLKNKTGSTASEAAPDSADIPAPAPMPPQTLSPPAIEEAESGSKTKLPSWAAFALGALTGVILTFIALAVLGGGEPENTLEARFGADRHQAVTIPANVALTAQNATLTAAPSSEATPAK